MPHLNINSRSASVMWRLLFYFVCFISFSLSVLVLVFTSFVLSPSRLVFECSYERLSEVSRGLYRPWGFPSLAVFFFFLPYSTTCIFSYLLNLYLFLRTAVQAATVSSVELPPRDPEFITLCRVLFSLRCSLHDG